MNVPDDDTTTYDSEANVNERDPQTPPPHLNLWAFIAVEYSEHDGCYLARPALTPHGIQAHGDTVDEAMAEAREVMRMWLTVNKMEKLAAAYNDSVTTAWLGKAIRVARIDPPSAAVVSALASKTDPADQPGDLDDLHHTRFSAHPIPDAVIAGGAWLFVVGALVFIGAALLAAVGMPL